MKTYHWDVLVTFHWDVIGCFIWDVPATSLGRTERRRYDVATTSCCRVVTFNVSVWLTGLLLTIGNILIKSWNIHIHFALDWSNAAWSIWWLKQLIKSCKLNESVVAITNSSCVCLLFECFLFWKYKNLTLHLPWLPFKPKQFGVG